MKQYYMIITSLEGAQVWFTRDKHSTKISRCSRVIKGESQEPIKRGLEEKTNSQSTANPSRFRCVKKLHGRVHYVQSLKSGHASSGVVRKSPNE